jgi:hypothetical protein
MKKTKCSLSIIFDFFIILIFLIRRVIKVKLKIKSNKHLVIEGVIRFLDDSRLVCPSLLLISGMRAKDLS